MFGGVRTILILTASVFLFGCRTPDQGISPPWRWLPGVPSAEAPDSDVPDWKTRAQSAQAGVAVVASVLGFLLLAAGFSGHRPAIGAGATSLAVGIALFALNELMDHWLWPWFALSGFLALVAWKIRRYRKNRS